MGGSTVTVAIVALIASSCAGGAAQSAVTTPSTNTAATTAPPEPPTLTRSPPATATTRSAPATTSTLPIRQLTSCVESAKFNAYTGNAFWSQAWVEAGETDAGMRQVCEFFAAQQPGWLRNVHNQWLSYQASTTSSTPLPTAPPPTAPPSTPAPSADPLLVQGCVDWFNWQVLLGNSDIVRLWEDMGTSHSRVRALCNEVALDDPNEARAMRDEARNIARFVESPPPPPPPAQSPPPRSSNCHPNYSGCVPIASDVDCAGGSGNGPAYTGRVRVLGPDVYDLDRDGDGIGCE